MPCTLGTDEGGWVHVLDYVLFQEGDLKSAVDKAADGIANLGDQVKETLREVSCPLMPSLLRLSRETLNSTDSTCVWQKAAEVEAESEVIRAEKERMGEVRECTARVNLCSK